MKRTISGMTHDPQPFWIHDPTILLDRHYITSVFPQRDDSLAGKLNAITRLVIFLMIIGYIYTQSLKLILTSVVTILAIVILYYSRDEKTVKEPMTMMEPKVDKIQLLKNMMRDEFQMPDMKNPLMNVMFEDYVQRPNRASAAPAYHPVVEQEINDKAKENINEKIFRDLGDELAFDQSMRNFYAMPNTQIPNDQEAFAQFCFGGKPSCRGGDFWQCEKQAPRHTLR